MHERGRRAGMIVLALFVISAVARIGAAGEWHSGETSRCSDCHTVHNSEEGAPMRYDKEATPAAKLLRHASAVSLCVYCHDGSVPGAPDVIAPVTYSADPAGGFFPETWATPSGTAHALGTEEPVLPPGGAQAMVLTCITCHDPHGTASYRILRTDPAGTGSATLAVSAKQKAKSDGTNLAQVYGSANVVDKAGLSAWCGACHGNFHGRASGEEGTASPWLRHPQDQALSSSTHVDYTHWLGTVENRVRVQSPSDDDIPSADDQVFCLSCHKAHGSRNRAALVFADASRLGSTCEQCHNK